MAHFDAAKGAQFHEGLAESWNNNYKRGGFKKRLAFVRRLLSRVVVPGENWLDAGCGAGILTLEMSGLGATGLAVDGSQQMIDAAMREVGPLSNRFAFTRVVSVTSIDVPEATFHGVLCSSVIEYVGTVDHALFEFNRVLKAGGKLILSVPNRHSLIRRAQKWLRNVGALLGLDPFPYLSVSVHDFTKEDLLQHLSRSGFSARALEGFDPILPGPFTGLLPPALYFVVAEKTSKEPLFRRETNSRDDHFLDVGANVGSYTVLAAGAVGARVTAVEPIPSTFAHLQRNVALNGLGAAVHAWQGGLSDSPGTLKFTERLDTVNHVLADARLYRPWRFLTEARK